jgi:ABC-type sugar transport system ATPase subunit
MARVLLDSVSLERSGVAVISDLTLAVEDGEMLVLVGPSGSGKTSLLRLVAGLGHPSGGDVLFDGRSMGDVPPTDRERRGDRDAPCLPTGSRA